MKKFLLMMGIAALSLVACDQNQGGNDYQLKIISPTGAPTLAFYNHVDNLTTNSTPSLVAAQLLNDEYDVVAFDFYNGLKSIKNNNGHFKLARILTAGNLVLVGINHNTEPTVGSRIVSFGENLLPDLAFKELYGSVGANIEYVGGVQEVAPVLKNGTYTGNPVDYVVIAEPVLTNTLATISDTSIYTLFSLRDKWKQEKGNDAIIPQAGLFINMNTYNAHQTQVETFLTNINQEISSALVTPQLIKTAFESVGDVNAQKEKFGIPAAVAYNVTLNGNGVGLLDSYNKTYINTFLNEIGKSAENYDNYIL